jgi:pyruvate/2-oxoglutarate dehydrogenase complex dihydrolipoamide dehydrogenase (E3) component
MLDTSVSASAAHNALERQQAASYRVIPWVVFTEPEIAHVGLTEPEARRTHGDSVRVATLPFTAVDRAVIACRPLGVIKVITSGRPLLGRARGGTILGAHIAGPGAGELIHEFVIAMQVRAFSGRLAQAIHAYPSMAVGVQQVVARLFVAGRARPATRARTSWRRTSGGGRHHPIQGCLDDPVALA